MNTKSVLFGAQTVDIILAENPSYIPSKTFLNADTDAIERILAQEEPKNTKASINGTYHGTSTKHLQMYLSESHYRLNRCFSVGVIFDRLLATIVGWSCILRFAY